jgi:hypothetical protein
MDVARATKRHDRIENGAGRANNTFRTVGRMVGRLSVKEGRDAVNIISIKWLLGLFGLMLTAGAVVAQDLSAGKTPAQLFSSDCLACHHLPNGLGKKYNTGSLTGFLRAHYTTEPDSAGALARYVMGFATLRAAPVTAPSAEEGVEELESRGRASNLSGDGEKPLRPWPQSNEEPPRPAAAIAQPGPAEAADPMARLRAYAVSGASPQEAAAESPNPPSGKSHRRDDNDTQPAPAATAAPVAPAVGAPPADANAMPPPAPLSAVTPALAASRGPVFGG